jgi:hypothetical protein
MRFDRFTVKAQEAIQAAEQEARQREATTLLFRRRTRANEVHQTATMGC